MKRSKIFRKFLVLSVGLWGLVMGAKAQLNPNYMIGSASGNYSFSYNQVPDNLVEIIAPVFSAGNGLSYQWESSTSLDENTFLPIAGENNSSYSFIGKGNLTQTTYFRTRVSDNAGGIMYSNILKVSVVSINWEDVNYIRTHDVLTNGITDWKVVDQLSIGIGQKLQTTNYLDGLGRSIENVSREAASPLQSGSSWGDLVQFSQYDALGREPVKYLSYSTTSQTGKYKTTQLADQQVYYSNIYNDVSAFSNITFDNSPLNRVMNVKEPGALWSASVGKSIDYDVNSLDDNVQIFSTDYVQGNTPINSGYYPANTLYKQTYTDEHGKKVIEYTDQLGKEILKKIQSDDYPSSAHSGWQCTYSIYDDFGLLRFKLQPEAVKYLDANNWSFAGNDGQKVLAGLCFQYNYDDKGRVIWKKAPGAAALNMIYDVRDRVVFTQDGNQAALSTPQWTTSLYDELDRPVITALYNTTESISNLQADVNNASITSNVNLTEPGSPIIDLMVDTRVPGANYSAQNTITFTSDAGGDFVSEDGAEFTAQIDAGSTTPPTTSTVVLNNPISLADINNPAVCTIVKYLFYDNYSFTNVKAFNNNFTNANAYSSTDPNVLPINPTLRTISFPTGSRIRVLGTNVFLNSTEYYDEKGRHIQTLEDNVRSGMDINTSQYHFDGRLLSVCSNHSTPYTGYNNFITLTKYLFDKLGRVNSVQKQYADNAIATVVNYDYDDMGRVKTKHLDPNYMNANSGSQELESLNYSFNIHNQITGINKDYALKTSGSYSKWGHFFGMYLGFDNADNVFTASRLNGQVTGQLWNTQGDDAQRKYDYSYDNAGRLINAVFNEQQHPGDGWSNSKMDFSVTGSGGQISYDLNGNLLTMLQKGIVPGSNTPLTVDDLHYTYASYSNQLQSVTDQMTTINLNGQFGDFKDGSNAAGTPDYVYDANGNVVVDLNKNIQNLNGGTNGISYNFLDKPELIKIVGKGTIQIVYNAQGQKLQRIYTTESGIACTTTYINNFVYQSSGSNSDQLSYINFEEGRLRIMQPVSQGNGFDALVENGNLTMPNGQMGTWDYFIRDYQQNVRMILTEETHHSSSTATMETDRTTTEDAVFGQTGGGNEVEATRTSTPPGWSGNASGFVSQLGNIGGHLGPNTLQKVMAGDQVSAVVQYYHQANGTNSGNNIVSNVVSNLLLALGSGNTSLLVRENAPAITSQLNGTPGFINVVQPRNPLVNSPQAYLTILFFDERLNFIAAADGGTAQVQVAATVDGNGAQLVLPNIKAPKNGYAYVYVSNLSDQDVYFDNLQVGVTAGNIIEEDHYYAYGLKIAGISSKKLGDSFEGLLKNNNLYNDKELFDDGDLNWYDYGFRNYDPQIGRFMQLDPLTDDYPELTPYQYAGCEPVANVDLDGLEPLPVTLPEVIVTAAISHAAAAVAMANAASMIFRTVTTFGPEMFNYTNAFGQNFQVPVNIGNSINFNDEQWNFTNTTREEYTRTELFNPMAPVNVGKRPVNPDDVAKLFSETKFIQKARISGNIVVYSNQRGETYQTASSQALGNEEYGSQAAFFLFTLGGGAGAKTAAEEGVQALDGSFSITEFGWQGYPRGIPRPKGPFRLLQGEEYSTARTAANNANMALSKELGLTGKFVDIHEITPVKFGGSPTNISNKMFLDRTFHQSQVTPFWNNIMKGIQ